MELEIQQAAFSLLGFGALLTWLATAFSSAMAGFVAYVAYRGALKAILTAATLVVIGTFVVAMNGYLQDVRDQLTAGVFTQFMMEIVPDTLPLAIGVSVGADVVRWFMDVTIRQLNLRF